MALGKRPNQGVDDSRGLVLRAVADARQLGEAVHEAGVSRELPAPLQLLPRVVGAPEDLDGHGGRVDERAGQRAARVAAQHVATLSENFQQPLVAC